MITKRFIDENATFEIEVPISWRYSLIDDKVHTFQEYEKWKCDTFQVSIINTPNNLPFPKENILGQEYTIIPKSVAEGFETYVVAKETERKTIVFSLTTENGISKKDLDYKKRQFHKTIATFKLLDSSLSEQNLNWYRFGIFLQGMGASELLVQKSIENQSFIEATCLLASQIDGLLRVGIVLQEQLSNNSNIIEKKWIYQAPETRRRDIISEKNVYDKAKELSIIDQNLYDSLYLMYENRNAVIHRFVISDITVAEIEEIAYEYYTKRMAIRNIIYDIETKQIEMGVGMTQAGGTSKKNNFEFALGKIGKDNFFKKKK